MNQYNGLFNPPQSGLAQLQQRQQAIAAQQQRFLGLKSPSHAMNQLMQAQAMAQHQSAMQQMAMSNQQGTTYYSPYMSTSTSSTTSSTASTSWFISAGNAQQTGTGLMGQIGVGPVFVDNDDAVEHYYPDRTLKIRDGVAKKIEMPDGTVIDVSADGSFAVNDKDAKVIYRAARIRDFNQYINVSDRLEEFIGFCGKNGVKQGEMMELPINLFIGWLVVQAARADKEPEPEVKLLPDLRRRITPRCPGCGRFTLAEMRRKHIEFCAPPCFERHYHRNLLALPAPQTRLDP